MPPKHSEELVKVSFTITESQAKILNQEALALNFNGTSELVREIFAAWIEEFHNTSAS